MEYIINEDCLDSATITHADATGNLCELVRCKNCKHWRPNTEFCELWTVGFIAHHTPPEWFCADGKVKEDG